MNEVRDEDEGGGELQSGDAGGHNRQGNGGPGDKGECELGDAAREEDKQCMQRGKENEQDDDKMEIQRCMGQEHTNKVIIMLLYEVLKFI